MLTNKPSFKWNTETQETRGQFSAIGSTGSCSHCCFSIDLQITILPPSKYTPWNKNYYSFLYLIVNLRGEKNRNKKIWTSFIMAFARANVIVCNLPWLNQSKFKSSASVRYHNSPFELLFYVSMICQNKCLWLFSQQLNLTVQLMIGRGHLMRQQNQSRHEWDRLTSCQVWNLWNCFCKYNQQVQ